MSNIYPGKRMSRLLKKEIERKTKSKIKSLSPDPDVLRTYIGTLRQVHSSPISDASLNAIQGYEDSEDVKKQTSPLLKPTSVRIVQQSYIQYLTSIAHPLNHC